MGAEATTHVVALDGGWDDLAAAEHAALSVLDTLGPVAAEATVCTHILRLPEQARYAVSIAAPLRVPGAALPLIDHASPGHDSPLGRLADAHAQHTGGRAVRFPGHEQLKGRMALDAVVAASAIDDFRHTGNPPTPDTVLDTRSFVRPTYEDGRLVLLTQPGLNGDVMPFEIENPTRCCEFHR